jgi:hypothetical protein
MSYADDELKDIELVKTHLNMLMSLEKPDGVDHRNFSASKVSHPGKCSDNVRRSNMFEYLDFLFPPNFTTWIAQYTASATDRTIVLVEQYDNALSLRVMYVT